MLEGVYFDTVKLRVSNPPLAVSLVYGIYVWHVRGGVSTTAAGTSRYVAASCSAAKRRFF